MVYANVEKVMRDINHNSVAYGRNQYGYGDKIATCYKAKLHDSNRCYRIYACCWSNVASCYIIHHKRKEYINDCIPNM